MNDPDCDRQPWNLDHILPELPAQGRWRGGPVNRRQRLGKETVVWHPGDGDRVIAQEDSVRTLLLEDTDHTLAQVLAAIRIAPESQAEPRLLLGEIVVEGVRGTIALGDEKVSFAGLTRIVIGGYSTYPARGG